jgi:hypothetical protein
MWVLHFSKPLKNLVYTHLREIRRNQVTIRYANFNETSKNSWQRSATKIYSSILQLKALFWVCRLPKNFSATPAAIFVDAHRYRKLIKV